MLAIEVMICMVIVLVRIKKWQPFGHRLPCGFKKNYFGSVMMRQRLSAPLTVS